MLRVGIFGTGHLGKFHLNNWKEIDGVELVGFYDPSDEAAAAIAGQYGLERFTDPEALIDACDAIDVVSPTPHHFATCAAAVRKGRHVFVEKPMANTMDEGEQLVKLVQESKVKLQVGHVERFNPAWVALPKDRLQPMFIEVHRLAQFNPRGTEVSVILDLMIHDIDLVLSIVKSDVKVLSASGVAVLTDTPDIANVRIEFDNGCVANLTSSRISLKKMRKMRLFQKDAYISVDFLDKKAEVIRMQQEGDTEGFTFPIETPAGTRNITMLQPPVAEGNAIRAELQAFVDAIRNDSRPVVNEIDGFRAMEVAHGILQKIHAHHTAS
ncbi:Gfo/Idh/MocA family oxidoreductase [Flaviaesturariibacter amylovorans]|uniref:Gfo/Idh/MocA family oxidoreductase n=1 Tax=Flaviaesturariibacter amylovorans TaxID=1084520 RepID=A0ABP8H2B7_9BACT